MNKNYKPILNLSFKVGDELYFINKNRIDAEKITKILYQHYIEADKEEVTCKIYTLSGKEISFEEIENGTYFLSKDELKEFIYKQ